MSVSIQTVEFERREAYLSELEDGPPYTVHGVALGADDVTVGQSGIKKLWPADELEKAAESLEGRSLVVDHNNGSDGVVGTVTKAGYKEETGVVYEAELFDDELAEKISNGLLEVSIRGKHSDVEQMEETDDGAKVVEDITFDNLSIVPTGAAPSNTIEIGETEELSMAELSAFTDSLESVEITPGMWVKTDGMKGITISQVQDGEIEVDIYEEKDGQWRSIEETEMVPVDDLTKWDVDEDDIGAVEDSDESSDEEEMKEILEEGIVFFDTVNDSKHTISSIEGDMVVIEGEDGSMWKETKEDVFEKISQGEWEKAGHESSDEEEMYGVSSVPHNLRFESKVEAMEFVETEDGLTGVHEMDGEWVPGDDHDEYIDWERSQENLAAEGDKVEWDDGAAQGVIADRKTEGCFNEKIDGDVEVCASEDEAVVLIEIVKEGERTGTMVAHKEGTVNSADFEMSKHKMDPDVEDDKESEQVDPPEFEEGMMVQWSVNPDMFGEIVHNPDDKEIIMVEVMEMMDREMKQTGHTLTAAPPDLEPMNEEEMSLSDELETFSDYPEAAKENAQMALDAREETDNPNDCGTDVGWKRANQLASGEAVSEDVVAKMSAFNRHRQNSDMDDDEGKADCGWMMWKAWGGDEGVDWASKKQEEIEEMEALPELAALEIHEVEFDGTSTDEWNEPAMEDFDTDDLEKIGQHFLVSKTGFPAENYTDLALPVVGPDGDLYLNALQNAKARAGQVDGVSDEDEKKLGEMIDSLANENFDDVSFGDEEEAAYGKRPRTVDDTGEEPGVHDGGPVDIALDMINKYLTIEGNHESDSVDGMLSWLMGSVDLPVETLGDFRMAARRFLDETPGTDSFDAMTVEQFRDWLLMHGKESQGRREQDQRDRMPKGYASSVNVLTGDDLRQMTGKSEESELDDITTKVNNMTEDIEEKLAELSEPVAVEQEDLEELQDKADRFEEMSDTLESLKERTDVLDDADREQVEELAEAEEPVVVESARMESLEEEAEQVAEAYAAELAEESFLSADELTDKFSISELREKYEEQIGDPAEELASSEDADPKSGDVDEEELEERADEGSDEEELSSESEEAEEMREELRSKILG